MYFEHSSNSRVRHLLSRREQVTSLFVSLFICFVLYNWSRHTFLWFLNSWNFIHVFFMLQKSNVHMLWPASRYPIWGSFVSPQCVTLSSILISSHLERFGSVNAIAMKCDRTRRGMGCLFLLLGIQFIHFFTLSGVFDLTPFNLD